MDFSDLVDCLLGKATGSSIIHLEAYHGWTDRFHYSWVATGSSLENAETAQELFKHNKVL